MRAVGSDAERARTAVTRTLRHAISKLAETNEPLAVHLGTAMQTGTYCSYRQDPIHPINWAT